MYDVEQLRQDEFPYASEWAYLNHAGISPLPRRAAQAAQNAIAGLNRQPGVYWTTEGMAAALSARERAAALINAASAEEITPITSTGAGLNAVAQALVLERGDNIVFCDLEFPSNAYPWMSLARDGIEARCIPADRGGLTIEQVEAHADERTRVVAVSAIQFFSGHRTDLSAIGQYCRGRGILFVVDAIQAVGHMPIDVQAMGIDVLATGGQKSLLGMPGTGFMYVRAEPCIAMQPRIICSTTTVDYVHWLAYDLTPLPDALRFSAGTPNLVGIVSMASSLELLSELGLANIDRHTTNLSYYAIERLNESGYEVITPVEACGPIVTFRSDVSNEETDGLIRFLEERHVAVVKHLDAAGNPYVRLSTHAYNTTSDIDRLIVGLNEWRQRAASPSVAAV